MNPGGLLVIGQDQDTVGGGFDRRQSFSGMISQFNIWNSSLEDFHIENLAECRSDAFGNSVAWKEELFRLGEEYSRVSKQEFNPRSKLMEYFRWRVCNFSSYVRLETVQRVDTSFSMNYGTTTSTRIGVSIKEVFCQAQNQQKSSQMSWILPKGSPLGPPVR